MVEVDLTGLLAGAVSNAIPVDGLARTIAHGVAQGTVSVLQGGKFGHGFISGSIGHAAKGLGTRLGFGQVGSEQGRMARTMVSALVGGTVSQLTGGKFANGAMTAAFVHLFNAESRRSEPLPVCQSSGQYNCIVSPRFVDRNTYGSMAGFTSSLTYGASESHGAYYGTDQAKSDVVNGSLIGLGLISGGAGLVGHGGVSIAAGLPGIGYNILTEFQSPNLYTESRLVVDAVSLTNIIPVVGPAASIAGSLLDSMAGKYPPPPVSIRDAF